MKRLLRQINHVGLNRRRGGCDRGVEFSRRPFDQIMAEKRSGAAALWAPAHASADAAWPAPWIFAPATQCCARATRTPAPTHARCIELGSHEAVSAHQGGPLQPGAGPGAPAAGKRAGAATTCTTRTRPAVQHGQRPASMRATRARNPAADSWACALLAGMCRAARAWANFAPLQAEANTP